MSNAGYYEACGSPDCCKKGAPTLLLEDELPSTTLSLTDRKVEGPTWQTILVQKLVHSEKGPTTDSKGRCAAVERKQVVDICNDDPMVPHGIMKMGNTARVPGNGMLKWTGESHSAWGQKDAGWTNVQ